MNNFTHAVYDGDELLRKYRWTSTEAKWYSDKHPVLKIVKLNKVKQESKSAYEVAYELVGECLL
jgi:hypothetical protein